MVTLLTEGDHKADGCVGGGGFSDVWMVANNCWAKFPCCPIYCNSDITPI